MLASRRRENQSRGRHRGRRQHPSSRVLRDLLGPGDPAPRARHRLLGLLRGGAAASRTATGLSCTTSTLEHAEHLSLLPGRHRDQPAVHHAADECAAGAPAHRCSIRAPRFGVWSVIELLLLALAVWIAIRAGPWPSSSRRSPRVATALMALAAGGTYAFLVLGQIDGVTALGLAAAYCGLAKGPPGRRRILDGARVRCHQAAPGDRARRLARRAPGLAGARAARWPGAPWSPPVSLILVGPSRARWLHLGPRLRRRQHPGREHARHPGPRRLVAGRRDRRGGHRDRRIAPRTRRMLAAWGQVARYPGCARDLARRGRGAVARGVAASAATRSRHPRPVHSPGAPPAQPQPTPRPWPGLVTIRLIARVGRPRPCSPSSTPATPRLPRRDGSCRWR